MSGTPRHPRLLRLLKRLQQPADQAARDRFVKLFTPAVSNLLKWFHVSPDDRDDLAQETLMHLLDKLLAGGYDSTQASFRNWLWRVVHNKAIDWLRAQQTDVLPGAAPLPPEVLAESDPQADLIKAEHCQQLTEQALQ